MRKSVLLSVVLLAFCAIGAQAAAPWWDDAVVYEIFVRSFNDSDGDGIGDFRGIEEKLDYIEELGATAIWLMPSFATTTYHGYDIVDYYAVNEEYGAMEDFESLLRVARFWIEKGVSGFRLDAAQNIVEYGPGLELQKDSPGTVAWWVEFNAAVKAADPEAMLVGEVWTERERIGRYHVRGKGLDRCFDFPFGAAVREALNAGNPGPGLRHPGPPLLQRGARPEGVDVPGHRAPRVAGLHRRG